MLSIPEDELLQLLYNRGYQILLNKTDYHITVTFKGKFTLEHLTLSHSYSLEWDDNKIKEDVVYDLLKWTGLKVKYTLDY